MGGWVGARSVHGTVWCARVCVCVHARAHTHIHTHAHTYTHAHTHAHTHTHTCTHMHTHAHTCTCTHVHTHAHTHAHTRVHTHACTHMHTHAHKHTHAHTHARAEGSLGRALQWASSQDVKRCDKDVGGCGEVCTPIKLVHALPQGVCVCARVCVCVSVCVAFVCVRAQLPLCTHTHTPCVFSLSRCVGACAVLVRALCWCTFLIAQPRMRRKDMLVHATDCVYVRSTPGVRSNYTLSHTRARSHAHTHTLAHTHASHSVFCHPSLGGLSGRKHHSGSHAQGGSHLLQDAYVHKYTSMLSLSLFCSLSHTHTHTRMHYTHTHINTRTHTHAHTHTHTHKHTNMLSHTHTHTHTHTQTHTHTHTHSRTRTKAHTPHTHAHTLHTGGHKPACGRRVRPRSPSCAAAHAPGVIPAFGIQAALHVLLLRPALLCLHPQARGV